MKNIVKLFISAILVLLVAFYSCKHEIMGPADTGSNNPPVAQSTCSVDTVYFFNEIQPIISSNCTMSGCHDNISHKEGVNLTSYSNILRYVKVGNAGSSKLYQVINRSNNDRMPPPPMPPLTSEQKNKIATWINQGANNNICLESCDTALYTYSGAIKPLMQSKCVGCHNPASLGGNVDLSTYNGVKASVANGKLYGSVAHLSGYSAMPKNAAKLSDCEIRQIQKWINAGSANN